MFPRAAVDDHPFCLLRPSLLQNTSVVAEWPIVETKELLRRRLELRDKVVEIPPLPFGDFVVVRVGVHDHLVGRKFCQRNLTKPEVRSIPGRIGGEERHAVHAKSTVVPFPGDMPWQRIFLKSGRGELLTTCIEEGDCTEGAALFSNRTAEALPDSLSGEHVECLAEGLKEVVFLCPLGECNLLADTSVVEVDAGSLVVCPWHTGVDFPIRDQYLDPAFPVAIAAEENHADPVGDSRRTDVRAGYRLEAFHC